jgi:hypothetical protein
MIGYQVIHSGTLTAAAGAQYQIGFEYAPIATVNSATTVLRGMNIDFAGLTNTNSSATSYGIYINTTTAGGGTRIPYALYSTDGISSGGFMVTSGSGDRVFDAVPGAAKIGMVITADATSANNAKQGLYISKYLTNATAAGAIANSQSALRINSVNASSAVASGALTSAQDLVSISMTNTNAVAAAADAYTGTMMNLVYSCETTGAGDITNAETALNIRYTLTETAGSLKANSFNVAYIDYDTVGAPDYANGLYNLLRITGDDAAIPTYAASVLFNGVGVNLSGMDVSDPQLTLTGISIIMPAIYDAATEYALYATGDGMITSLLADGVGHNIIANTVDADNTYYGLTISKNLTGALTVNRATSLTAAEIRMDNINTSATDFDLTTGGNVCVIGLSHTSTVGGAKTDVDAVTARGFVIDVDLVTSGVNDKIKVGSAHTAFCIDYTETQTGGLIDHQAFELASIQYNTTGNVDYDAGSYDLLYILGTNNAGAPTYAATTTVSGLKMDLSGMTVTDPDLVLNGLNIIMPVAAPGTSVVNAITTNGRINTTAPPLGINGSSISIGTYATPVVDINASDAFAFTVNMSTGVNKTGAGDSCMGAYVRMSNTADGANTRLQGVLASTSVAFDCYDAYGLQSNMTIGAGAVATGNLTAVSGKVVVSDAVATGIISAGLFTLEGAFNPIALTYGVWIDITAGITADSGLMINNNASVCTNGINLQGTYTSHITSSATMIIDMPVTTPGAGFDTAGGVLYIPHGKKNIAGMFYEEIFIDLATAAVTAVATDHDVIGEAGGGAAYIGRITAALNGTVQAIEIICMEVPAGGNTDIDFYSAAEATWVYDDDITASGTEVQLVDAGGAWTLGMVKAAANLPTADHYIYLANGAAAGAGAYTAGKFIVRIYGS